MKIITIVFIALLSSTLIVSCGSESEDSDASSESKSSEISLSDELVGTWQITDVEGDGGISKDLNFVFEKAKLTLDAGYYKDEVKLNEGNASAFSYKDQNDILWKFKYHFDGDVLVLENLFNDKVHATYKLSKK